MVSYCQFIYVSILMESEEKIKSLYVYFTYFVVLTNAAYIHIAFGEILKFDAYCQFPFFMGIKKVFQVK